MTLHSMPQASPAAPPVQRHLPIGAQVVPGQGVHFRVWAPRRHTVEVLFEDPARPVLPLEAEPGGYFSGFAPAAGDGLKYRFRLDGGNAFPDPASRFQPQGPHGPSQVVDPSLFGWTDRDWPGITSARQVLYELHIGTFTPEGTWAAAADKLQALAELGVTCIEAMPVADFAGEFGWGYDGVNLFAPTRLYGGAEDFRRFIDRAHAVGLGVILDVVYNHLGPDGNYLTEFSDQYFTDRHCTEWGRAINYDDADSGPVREFFISNARYWIEEFHLDGFRFDATQAIFDTSPRHILLEISQAARAAAGNRSIYLVAENEPQVAKIVRPVEEGGYGFDALWNDDFHHSALVNLTGRSEAYYADYTGRPQEFLSAAKWGYLYQGQRSMWQTKRRGTPTLDVPHTAFVNFIENHDQVANSAWGKRAHQLTSFGQFKAMTAMMLMMPQTPMLFQGQEFNSNHPFLYFADHTPELAALVRKGRAQFMKQFPSVAEEDVQQCLHDPADPRVFARCKLDRSDIERHWMVYALYRDLLGIRREQRALDGRWPGGFDGAVLGDEALALRYFGKQCEDLLILVNFGRDLHLAVAPEPLLAPPMDRPWRMSWSSEDPRYGGTGTAPVESGDNWRLPARAAIIMAPAPCEG